jgi:hypothetical protein
MATFNLTAQLNLKGPTNVKQIAAQIKKDLGTLNANVQFKLDPAASKNVAALSSSLKVLNANFASTVKSANAATSAIKAFGNSVNSVKINNVPQQINQTSSAIAKLNKVSSSTSGGLQNAATEMQEFGKQAGLAVRRFVAFSAVTSVIYGVTNSINNGIQAFIDYDKELVKLQQVTGESAAGLSKLQSQIGNLAVEFGVSSKELTQVASTLAQAGLSARETEKALKALALSSLAPSFDNMNETVEGSIAIMRQFGISANDLEASLGAVNAVAARFAVESSDIITAVQRTGSVFATASKGVSEGKDALNEFISVFTSIRATSRESAETIATGLRTIFTRVQRGTTIDALKEFGVNLTDAEGKFVGAYKAVELLSKGLGKIDPRSLDFSRIVEELGGFRQIGKVIPLIQQFTVTQQALKVAQQGQASLAKDAATAQLSLANQISKVREEFFSLFREIGQSKGFQSLVRGALSLTSGLIKVADAVKGILPALAVLAAFKGFKALTEFTTGFATGVKRGPDGKANGGVIRKFARGGVVPGTGSGDTVPAMLEPGEFVIRKKAVETIGTDSLHSMNKYGGGGSIRGGRAGKRQRFGGGGKAPEPLNVVVDHVYDGDSPVVNFTPKTSSYDTSSRLVGIDTFERRSKQKWKKNLALEAKKLTETQYTKGKNVTENFTKGYSQQTNKERSGRPLFVDDNLKQNLIDKGLGFSYSGTGPRRAETITKAEYLSLPEGKQNKKLIEQDPKNFNKKNLGGKIQKFAVGGKVARNLGYIDFDIINDPANAKMIEEQMKKSGSTGPREYTQYLTDLAIKAKKETTIKKLTALYGVAGAGKSSIAMGRGANDTGRLRETNRFPILTPEDISKASEVMLLTSTVSKDKLDGTLKEADKIYALSTTTQEEKDRIRKQRMMRDVSGVGLFGRRAGATTGVPTDSAKEEALLTDRFGSKAMILGRGNSGRLRRKRGNELVETTKKKLALTWGGFSPTTAGHESLMDAAKASGIPYEDFIALVGANEAVDTESYRTAIFDQDFRLALAKAGFGSRGASVLPKAFGDMSVPLAFDMGEKGGRRQITLAGEGSMVFVADKKEQQLEKYKKAGYGVANLERTGGISGTQVRDLVLNGNLEGLQKVVSPGVFSLLKDNLPQLQNRSNILPSLIQQSQDIYKQQVASIDEQLAATGITRADNKKAAIDPDYAAQLEIYQYLKEQKKKLATKASFEPYRLLKQLAEADPDKYALKLDRAGENGIVGPPQISGLQEAILKKVAKETSVQKSSGILPAQGSEILKRFGTSRLPTDASFGPFSGKTVRDTAEGGKLKYWNSAFRPETKADKLAYYTATRDYLIDKFNESQGIQRATALEDTTNAVLSSKQLGLVGLNPLGYTGLLGPETWNLGIDPSGQERSIDASIVQRGLPTQYQNVIDYLSGQTEEIVGGASKLLGISPKKLSKKQRETLGQGNIEGALLEQIFGSADATILDDALRTRPIDFPMGIGPKAAKIFGIDPDIPTEVKRTIDSGSKGKAVEEFQKYFRAQYGIPEPKNDKMVQKLSGGGLLKKYGEIFPNNNSTGPFKEMVFDFDDTLVTGGEIRKPDGSLDLSQKDNIPLVEQMLKKGKLTPLGQHLSEAIKKEPSLVDNVSILSARNQNQAGILADTLSRLGLPIPVSKIRGSDGPQNKKITGYQKMIDDNLETITRLKGQGHEAIHYTFAKGGKVEEEYKSILASILPKEMLTLDGYLKMPSGQAEPIDFIPGRSLAEKSKSSVMSILLGKAEQVPPEEQTGAFYQGALMPKVLRHNLEKYKDTLPEDEYKALKQFVDHRILFEGNDDTIKTAGGLHKGVLAHESFHDVQGYLYDNHPEIIDKLHESLLKRKDAVEKWYKDPKNAQWAGPKDYRLEHFFPTADTKSPYNNNLSVEAYSSVQKRLKRQPDDKIFKALGESQWDFGKNELVPVLLSAAVENNKGAIELLSQAFGESGLNPDFYKTLPQKRKLGGVIRDIWHGTTTGKDDSVLESFKKYGAKSDIAQGFGQGQGFYVYSDPTSAMVRAMELEGGANYLTSADPKGKPMALKFTELLDGKNWDLDYEFQNADIVNFIHSHYDKVKEAVAKSRGVDLGTNLKDFSLDKKYDEYLDTTDNTMMRKVGISFKDQGKDTEKLLANNHYGDIRSAEVLNSLVKSLMHSDPDFYEEFENSFFSDLKPKQGLKYVGKDPLKPVLAKIFDKQKTEWETAKFATGGSVEDTVPALLTPGEFVVNKNAAKKIGYNKLHQLNKADKIQGYNKGGIVGGVQKFAFGGGVDSVLSGLQNITSYLGKTQNITSNRPNSIDTSTIAVDPSILQDTKAFVDTLYDAGDGMKYLNRLLNENKQLSIKAVLDAGNKDLERLKISGASIDKIIEAEKALSNIRNKGLIDITKRQFLEAGFKESSVGKKLGSGATQQKILSLAEKEERRLIDKRKKAIEADIVSSSKQPIAASDLADQVAQAISSELNDIKSQAFAKAATTATGTQTSTGIKGNITASELKNLNISGNDIQKYISDSMRDRKTLRQMDQQLIATRMEEYKNAGTIRGISVASAEEAKKLAQEEVSKRREAINDLAKMRGEQGVGAAGLMDTRNSPINRAFKERYFTGNLGRSMQRGLGDVGLAAGLVAGQGQNISSALFDTKTDKGKIKAADAGARIDKAATTLSVGLTTSAQLAAINPMLGAAAAIGTALYAGADAAFDFSGTAKKAAQEMTRSLLNDKLSAASDNLSNALEKLSKDVNNVDLRAKTASEAKALTDTAIESTANTATAGKNKAENDRSWADFGRGILLGIGEIGVGMNPYYQDLDPVTVAKSKKGSYGMEEARVDAQKEVENYQKIANAGYGDLERLYAKGFSNDQIMDPNNQAGNIVRESIKGMILSDPEKLARYMASGPQGREAIAGKAAQDEFLANDELAKASQESAKLARAMDLADKAGRRLAASFDKIADIVNESVNKISFESDARIEATAQYASSLRGESKVSGPKLREKNILDNPNAYSEAEFTKALESATAGLDAGLRKQLIGGAQLQQNIPKNITQSIATVLKTSASAGVDEAKKAAIDTAKNEIENNPNLSRQQKDELKQIATAKIENMAKKAKDNNADNSIQLSEFQKELEDGTNILGDFGKKLLDSVKNLSSFKEGALDKFAKGLNEASKAAKEAQNYFRKSRDISNEGNMNLREILSGYGETYNEKSNRIMGDVSNLAGGETTVQGIQNRQIRLSQQRDTLQKQQGTLTDKDALRNNVEQLNKLDDQLQNNREALDMLANSTELVDKAFSDLQHTSELQNNRQNFVNQLLTNTPEEADKLNQSFIRLQRNLSGGLNSPYNQRDARKAFNEALFKTGNVREATRAGNTVLANQRKETLALSQDPGVRAAQELQIRNQYAQNQGKPGVDADQAVAEYFQKQQLQLTKQMAIESGMINNPLVQQSLAALQDRKTDPSMQKAAERYLESVGLRSGATKGQGELALMESQSILKDSNDNLRISIDDLRASVEGNMRNANIGKDAAGNNVVNPGIAVPAPPVARSSGGLIYASNGKLIDFKPKGTDTVPAMLSPGEFVINAKSTQKHLPLLESINSGYFDKGGLVSGFSQFDKDKNNLLDRKEFTEYFSDFDLNKDNVIDMKEFRSGMSKQNSRRKSLWFKGSKSRTEEEETEYQNLRSLVDETKSGGISTRKEMLDRAKGQIRYERQQAYLSRFRPEIRERKEKSLLQSGMLYYPDGTSPRGKMFKMEGSRSTQNVADLILPPPYKNVPNTINPNTELLLPNPSVGMLNSTTRPQRADVSKTRDTYSSPEKSALQEYVDNNPEYQTRNPVVGLSRALAHLREIKTSPEAALEQSVAAQMMGQAEAPDFVDAKGLPFVKGVDVRLSEQQAKENARMMSDEQQKKKNDTIVKDREERLKGYEAKKVAMKLREKTIREYFGNDPEGKRRADKVIADLPLWDKTTAGRSADYNTKFDADIIQMGLYRGKSLTNWNRSDLISPDEAVYRYEAQVKRREDYMKGRAAGDFDKFDPSESPKVKGIMGWLTGKDKGEPTKIKGISTMSEPIKPDVKSVGTAPTSKDIKTDPVTFRPLNYSENDIAKLNSEVKDLETDLAFKSKDEYTKKLLEKKKGTLSAIQQATTQAMEVRAALNNQTESRYQELKQQANSGKMSGSLEKEYIKLSLQRGVPYGQIRAFAGNISSVEDDMRRRVFSDAEMKQWSRQQRKEFESGLATEKETSFYDKVASELSDIARKNVDSSVTKLTGNKQLGQAAGLGAGFGTGVLTSVGNPSTTAVGVSTAGMGYLSSIGLQAAAGTTAAGLQYGAGQNEAAAQTLKDTATMAAINLGLRILTDPRSAKLLEQAKKEFTEGLSNPPSLKEFLNDPEMRELGKALGYTDLLETIKTGNAVDTTSMLPNAKAAVKGIGDALENIPTAGALRGAEYGFSGPGIPRAAPSKVTLGGTSTLGLTPPKTSAAAAKVGSSVIEASSLGGVNNITRLSTVDADAIMQARRGEIFENAVVAADEFSKMSPAAKKAFKEARAARKQNGPSSLKQPALPTTPKTESLTSRLIKKGALISTGAGVASQVIKTSTAPATKKPQKKANGGLIYAENGQLIDFSPKGTDTVPAMLTPGEFVVNAKSTKENLGLLHSINKSKGGPVNYLAKGGKSDKEQRSNDALSSYNSAASLEQISQNYKINEAMTDDGSSAASFMGAVTTGSANAREKNIAYQDAVIEQGKSAEAFALGAGTGGVQLGAGVAASYATAAGLTALAPFTGGASLAIAPVVVPAVGALFGMAANKATNNVLEATGTKEYADSIKEASPLAYNVGSALPAVGAVGSQIASKGVQAFAGSAADRAFGATTGALSDAAVQVATQGGVKDWKSVAISATTAAIMPGKGVYEESQASRRLVGGTLSRAGEVTGSQTLLNAGGEMRFSPGDRALAASLLADDIKTGRLYHAGAGWISEGNHASPILPRPSKGALGATSAISPEDLAANPRLSTMAETAGDHMRMGESVLGHIGEGAYFGAVGSKSQAEATSLAAQAVDYAAQATRKGSGTPMVLEVKPTDKGFVRKAINNNMHEPNPTLSANIGESLGIDPGSINPIPHSNRVSQTTPADVLTTGIIKQQQRIAEIRKTSGNAAANLADSMLSPTVSSSLPSAVSSPAYRTLGVPETQAPHWDINVPNPSATLGGSQSTSTGINLYTASERNHGVHGLGQIAGHVGKHEIPHLFGEHEPGHHSSGGLIYANNGALMKASGTDNVPAMLTEGEFVINKKDSKKHMPLLNAINSGYFNRGGIVNYLANGGIAGPQYLAAGGLGSISNSNISILPELLNKLSNMGMNSSGGTSQLAPISNVVQTLKQTASSSGGVSNNVSIDTANIASSIQDAVTNAIGQFNEYTEQIGANFTEQFNSAQKSLSSSIDTFQTATAQFGEHANAIPTSLSANVTQTTSLHHLGLDAIKGNMEQKIYDTTSVNAQNISQNNLMQFDKNALEGGANTAAKQSIIGRTV